VRLATLCLLAAALPGTARADEGESERAFAPVPTYSFAIGLISHATYIAGLPETGLGPSVEVALGSGRSQLFGEAALAYVSQQTWTSSAYDARVIGWMGRAGLGVRWLARQVELEEGFATELYLLAAGGAERFWWHGGGKLTRPDLDVGLGIQIRSWKRPRFAMRIEARVVFTPGGQDTPMVACRGSCPANATGSGTGLMTGLVFAW